MRIAVKLLFAGEKKVCDQIFEGVDSLREQCFADVTANCVAVLLSFGEAIAKSKRSPEKLFVLLDMYEIMRELQPEIEILFEGKYCAEMRKSSLDGTVHPLTSYVINYVKFLFDYQSTLKQLFQEFDDADCRCPVGNCNITSVRRSEAKDLLGDDWIQIHRRTVQQHANQYKRISWSKILQCLTIQGVSSSGGSGPIDSSSNSGVSRAMVKDRFKNFNIMFEELHQRQSQWTVPDSELRESLRLTVAEVLLPAYRSFVKRFGPLIENGKSSQKYIRFSPEDLEHMLAEFFEGKTWNELKR
ncbi:hypothetical protein F0562_015939 [Nyssa sinensis]|uniref:Exocyst subunit Exo70 family protein n=1 Tax=Nyssa sinensis TaxID=561372 RepID=A0A5J4ZIP4_9ASTE|nr:hypothetical protein F0562_015939 [Nyssa sinensis]